MKKSVLNFQNQFCESGESEKGNIALILILVNVLAAFGVLGLFTYSKLIFKKPIPIEKKEREQIENGTAGNAESQQLIQTKSKGEPLLYALDPIQANITPKDNKDESRNQFVSIKMSLELRDASKKDKVDQIKPYLTDKMLSLLGKKSFEQLTNVHDRYLLRHDIVTLANELLGETLVTNVYFNEFVVQ